MLLLLHSVNDCLCCYWCYQQQDHQQLENSENQQSSKAFCNFPHMCRAPRAKADFRLNSHSHFLTYDSIAETPSIALCFSIYSIHTYFLLIFAHLFLNFDIVRNRH